MDTTTMITIVILVLVIVGTIVGLTFTNRKKTENLQTKFGPEYEHTVQAFGNEKKAQVELNERQKHVDSLEIHPLTNIEHERYLADWIAVQSKFVDQPGQAIVDADHLIMEVMQLRNYPISDFEQRAADVSVSYPSLVGNYRAARVIALKNMEQMADTEELRQAMIYYRSLFEELLETDAAVA
ncbi:MAG: hypothetical protein WCK35_01160 [Chloroflexota bacterium]